nr:serine hydroxymethyltransferase [Fodinicola feengrottensis]
MRASVTTRASRTSTRSRRWRSTARRRAFFGAAHANVQPYSGAPANLAIYLAFLQPGETVLGMSLPMGGHLTHGWGVSATGKWFRGVQYGVRKETGRIDMDEVRDLALAERPKLIFCGGTAVPRTIDFAAFAEIAHEVGAVLAADVAHIAGLIAAGVHPSPIPHADVVSTTTHKTLRGPRGAMLMAKEEHAKAVDRAVFPGLQGGPHNHTTAAIAVALKEAATEDFRAYAQQVVTNAKALGEELAARGFELVSGGTDNHLLLMDVTSKGIAGKPAAQALDRAGIVVNYNTVPFDPRKPFDPSGLRIGTPSLTSRGLRASEMATVAGWIDRVVEAARDQDEDTIAKVRSEVKALMDGFPAPGFCRSPDRGIPKGHGRSAQMPAARRPSWPLKKLARGDRRRVQWGNDADRDVRGHRRRLRQRRPAAGMHPRTPGIRWRLPDRLWHHLDGGDAAPGPGSRRGAYGLSFALARRPFRWAAVPDPGRPVHWPAGQPFGQRTGRHRGPAGRRNGGLLPWIFSGQTKIPHPYGRVGGAGCRHRPAQGHRRRTSAGMVGRSSQRCAGLRAAARSGRQGDRLHRRHCLDGRDHRGVSWRGSADRRVLLPRQGGSVSPHL